MPFIYFCFVGVIIRQSFKSSVYTYVGTIVGAASLLYFFPRFFTPEELGAFRLMVEVGALLAGFGLIFAGFTGGNGLEGFEFIGFAVLIFAGINYIFIWGLNNYNNTIRVIYGVFCGFGLLSALATFNLISIGINGFQVYAVFFHAPTVALFKQVQSY